MYGGLAANRNLTKYYLKCSIVGEKINKVGNLMKKQELKKTSANSQIDENWFEAIATGDDNAFTKLYYASYKQLYGFLLSLTKNKEDAEDLLQNTYIKIINGSHLYKKQGTPMTWMCTIAKNQYLDFVRKYGKNRGVDFGEVENYISEGMEESRDDTKKVENKMLLETAFGILGEEERTIVVLHMINGLKHREIAELTGLTLSTVLSKYNRSLKKMKSIIE